METDTVPERNDQPILQTDLDQSLLLQTNPEVFFPMSNDISIDSDH